MPSNHYTDNEKAASRVWTWLCSVPGCVTEYHGRPSGGIKPVKYSLASKMARKHMDEKHPGLDRHSGIVKRVGA